MKVLIAEDSDVTRHLLRSQLQNWGYEVVLASDGTEAWRVLQQPDAPRLAILDWMMPGLDGVDVCRRVRALGAEPYIYVILLTGRDRSQDIVRGLGAGADDYITKPFEAQELEVRARAGRRIVELSAQLVAANEKLRIEASHDALTGLRNRRALMEVLTHDCGRAAREHTPMALVMIDLDHFKRVNDTHGHGAGDDVLREASRRMSACLRPYDVLARFGGEEFMLVLPACQPAEAIQVAERLRIALHDAPFPLEGAKAIQVTCSAGIATCSGGANIDTNAFIEAADVALYRAKSGGRNRVELNDSGSAMGPESPPFTAPTKASSEYRAKS